MVRVKNMSALLGLLVFLTIGHTIFLVNPASAGHNCWRYPYHCAFTFGTVESTDSVSHLSPTGSPTVVRTASGGQGGKFFVYSILNPNNKIEVELEESAKEYFRENKATKALGFITLRHEEKKKGKKHLLAEFTPADPHNPYPDPSIPAEEWLRRHMNRFEETFPPDSHREK